MVEVFTTIHIAFISTRCPPVRFGCCLILSILSLCFLNLTRAAESRPTTRSFGGVRATPSLRNCSFYASKRAIGMKLLLGYIFFVPWSISFAAQCLYTFFQTYKTLCKMLVLLGKLMHQKEIL